ncbi:MAG: HD domain-containing protein [Nitrospiraceae bacterium]|nr:HD domain-containing protein [Nitrospiraceae bacterium]
MTEGRISDFTASLMAAFSNCALYSASHPIVGEFAAKAFVQLKDLYENGALSITLLGEGLVFNNTPLAEMGIHFGSLARKLRRKGIEKIEIREGLSADEFRKFISGMASNEHVLKSEHISVGIIELRTRSDDCSLTAFVEDNLAKIKEAFKRISNKEKLDMGRLEDSVAGLLTTLKKEANVLSILSPVKAYNEYTYTHATNVSVLTIFQAETLGMHEELVCDVGLAGLLHDVGKLFVPVEVLEKQSKLDPDEWELMKLHPLRGARYLSTLPNMPRLAMVVAFEHHRKFDGSGYPGTREEEEKQHLISQMVAISDFFDALRTERPYRKSVGVASIVNLLKEGAGTEFNPFLVDHFIAALTRSNTL